jgi:exonuclease SbcC
MIPTYLRIEGFLSYNEPAELDFEGFELACISGANGSGKSSMLDAMTWAIFGQARRRDDAVINSNREAAEVVFDFIYEQQQYRIQRSKARAKTMMLEFFIKDENDQWRPLTEHSMRETELRIEETLRMDYETFINASFFLQGKADQFAQQRPGDRKRILSNILGLEIWETYRERSAEKRRRLEMESAIIEASVKEIEEELALEDTRRKFLAELEEKLEHAQTLRSAKEKELESLRKLTSSLDEQKKLVSMLEDQFNTAKKRLEQRQNALLERQSEFNAFQQQISDAESIQFAYQAWLDARQELERWNLIAADFRHHEAERTQPVMEIEKERARFVEEIRVLREKQRTITAQKSDLESIALNMKNVEINLDQLQNRLNQKKSLEDQLKKLQETQAEALSENKRLRNEMEKLKNRIDKLKEATGAECPLCGQPLDAHDRELLIEKLAIEGKTEGDLFRSNKELVKTCQMDYAALEANIQQFATLDDELRAQQRSFDQFVDRKGQIEQQQEDWYSQGQKRLDQIEQVLVSEDFAHEARKELARIDAVLKDLGYDAAKHDRIRKAEESGRESEIRLRALETARAAVEPIQREIKNLESEISENKAQAEEIGKAFSESAEKYRIEADKLPDLRGLERALFDLQEQENHLRMQVGGAFQAVNVLETQKQRLVDQQDRRDRLTAEIVRYKALEQAFGKNGVPALLIEQALPDIEAQANVILDRLTSGGMSVRFETQQAYKDKKRRDKKETLDILISDAAGVRQYEMFSGGEAFRINFAIRLALSRMLAQRAGARLQMLVIDEGFGSQDAEGKQRLIEAINLVRTDFEKILVITHMEELKDAFSARIEVEKAVNGSRMQVVL